ncbi:MAG: Kinesin light chain 3 [Geoglossum simile]|nr:MAG: Kinesin light chain 3 [Geoglossum simile]
MKIEVLEKRRQILGEEHSDTISAMSNLANMLGYQGKHNEAAAMIIEVLQKRRQILGEEHRDTITAMNNLANMLGDQGKHDEAAAMMIEVLEKMRQILREKYTFVRMIYTFILWRQDLSPDS